MDARRFFSSDRRNSRSVNARACQKDAPQFTPPSSYGPGDILQSGTRVPLSEQENEFDETLFDERSVSLEHMNYFDTPTSRPHGDRVVTRTQTFRVTTVLQKQQKTLEEQQRLLAELLVNQQKQSAELDEFKKKLLTFEQQLSEQSSSLSEAPTPKRIKISRSLLKTVNEVHAEKTKKFNLDERYDSVHNKDVLNSLVTEICKCNQELETSTVKEAVRRMYTNKRRDYLESMKKDGYTENLLKSKKYRARRQRKFDRRSQVVTKKEMKYWEKITVQYMTEESDDDESGSIVTHKLLWRSPKVNEWMKALDTRYQSKHKDAPVRNRIEGSISTCNPPQGAPNWAVVDNWHDETVSQATRETGSTQTTVENPNIEETESTQTCTTANPNSEVPVDKHEEGEDNLNDNDIDGDFEDFSF